MNFYDGTNYGLNYWESAYIKHHSTETAVMYVYDNLINAIFHRLWQSPLQQVRTTVLPVIGLRSIMALSYRPLCSLWYHRSSQQSHCSSVTLVQYWSLCFSWFAYHLVVSEINVITTSIYVIMPAYAVSLKVLFLVLSLLSILYTTPFSALISSLSLNHHLYADDTHNFFSLSLHLIRLQHHSAYSDINALQQISSWMAANL